MNERKSSKKEKKKELRELDRALHGGTGVDYSKISDRHIDDHRYEREMEHKKSLEAAPFTASIDIDKTAPSATYDAFIRLQTGQNERTIADKINDPNRVTWDHFKKINADKLELAGSELKKMIEYRKQLDKDRDGRLTNTAKIKKRSASSDSSSMSSTSSAKDTTRRRKAKKHSKKKDDTKSGKKRKKKKSRKHRTEKNTSSSSGSSDTS